MIHLGSAREQAASQDWLRSRTGRQMRALHLTGYLTAACRGDAGEAAAEQLPDVWACAWLEECNAIRSRACREDDRAGGDLMACRSSRGPTMQWRNTGLDLCTLGMVNDQSNDRSTAATEGTGGKARAGVETGTEGELLMALSSSISKKGYLRDLSLAKESQETSREYSQETSRCAVGQRASGSQAWARCMNCCVHIYSAYGAGVVIRTLLTLCSTVLLRPPHDPRAQYAG